MKFSNSSLLWDMLPGIAAFVRAQAPPIWTLLLLLAAGSATHNSNCAGAAKPELHAHAGPPEGDRIAAAPSTLPLAVTTQHLTTHVHAGMTKLELTVHAGPPEGDRIAAVPASSSWLSAASLGKGSADEEDPKTPAGRMGALRAALGFGGPATPSPKYVCHSYLQGVAIRSGSCDAARGARLWRPDHPQPVFGACAMRFR